jgi:hypothetical protein
MKLSLEQLAAVAPEDVPQFLRLTGIDFRHLENYVGHLLNEYRGTYNRLADKMGQKAILDNKENIEIITFLLDNIDYLKQISANFNLFKNEVRRNVPVSLAAAKRLLK